MVAGAGGRVPWGHETSTKDEKVHEWYDMLGSWWRHDISGDASRKPS